MLRLAILCIFSLLSIGYSLAQTETIELKEIVIEGLPFEKFMTGSKISKADSVTLAELGQSTLADYMQENSTVYIREQGNNMLATVSFRGTGSSHTGIFWHGLNLNSLTLGNSDFNDFPLFLFDGITVQYGGASSLHGSDAIGGSIHFDSSPQWTTGLRGQIQQDFGSFGNVFTGVKVDVGNGKWESKTRIFNRQLKNDFTYQIQDRLGESYEITQENAEVHNYGVLQEFNRKIGQEGALSLKGWYGRNYHQIQPLMVTNPEQEQDGDEIESKNLRLLAEYTHFFKQSFLSTNIGYVHDYQLFNDSDVIEIRRIVGNLNYEWDLTNKTTLKAGGNTKYIIPNVWSYPEDITEWRGDVFASVRQLMGDRWQGSFNLRKTFVPFTSTPVAPSASVSYQVEKGNRQMVLRGQLEQSFRVPTFNDRYWPLPGLEERPELNSERGYSGELGHNLQYQWNGMSFESDISAYYMQVDDWIMWVPQGTIWVPENKRKVEAYGVEINGKWNKCVTNGNLMLAGMYAYNRSILLKGITENDPAVGYQLPYTPIHRAVLSGRYQYKSYKISFNASFTSERRGIDVINEQVDGFTVTNLRIAKTIPVGKSQLWLEGKVLNLFDAEYQNVRRFAMPGRNYLVSLNFFIKD